MRSLALGILLLSASAQAQSTPSGSSDALAPFPASQPAPPAAGAPAPARAPGARGGLTTVVVAELPEACRDLGKIANSTTPVQAQSARISLANCLVEHKLRLIPLCDCEQSVRDIEAATAQSFALLDEVFLAGDATIKVLARQAQGDLLSSLVTRMLATVPPMVDTTQSAIALRETRLSMLQPLINPWNVRAHSAYMELDRIARDNPQLAKNPAVVTAVRTSRAKLAAAQGGVAKR